MFWFAFPYNFHSCSLEHRGKWHSVKQDFEKINIVRKCKIWWNNPIHLVSTREKIYVIHILLLKSEYSARPLDLIK